MTEKYRDAVPTTLFIFSITMVLAAFTAVMLLLISNRHETLVNRQNGLVNQTYARATNCFAATTPIKRTPDYVKECYDKAEATTGAKVERYGDAK